MLYRVDVARTFTATFYVAGEDADTIHEDADILIDEMDIYDMEFDDDEVNIKPTMPGDILERGAKIWTGGPDGDFVSVDEWLQDNQ